MIQTRLSLVFWNYSKNFPISPSILSGFCKLRHPTEESPYEAQRSLDDCKQGEAYNAKLNVTQKKHTRYKGNSGDRGVVQAKSKRKKMKEVAEYRNEGKEKRKKL
jgi:hypothetical protein